MCGVLLRASGDLLGGLVLGGASLRVVLGAVVPARVAEDDLVEGRVGLAVAAVVELALLGVAGGCLDGAGAAQGGAKDASVLR